MTFAEGAGAGSGTRLRRSRLMPEPETDAQLASLAERIRRGELNAMETLFRMLYAPLCSFAAGLVRSSDAAEDVVQEVFVALWANHARWEVRGNPRPYLYRAVRNRSLNAIRQQTRRDLSGRVAPDDEGPPGMGQPQRAADEQVLADEISLEVQRAVDSLPERARLAAVLRWRHGLKYQEIAEVLGISVKGVENQLARSLKTLRARFEEPAA